MEILHLFVNSLLQAKRNSHVRVPLESGYTILLYNVPVISVETFRCEKSA